jgi:hypothetical protein
MKQVSIALIILVLSFSARPWTSSQQDLVRFNLERNSTVIAWIDRDDEKKIHHYNSLRLKKNLIRMNALLKTKPLDYLCYKKNMDLTEALILEWLDDMGPPKEEAKYRLEVFQKFSAQIEKAQNAPSLSKKLCSAVWNE